MKRVEEQLAALRRLARAYVPEASRLAVAAARRGLRDRLTGDRRRLARRAPGKAPQAHCVVAIRQPIRRVPFLEGKLTNIRLGIERLDDVVIRPDEIFSFWALVGRPCAQAGFVIGRSIRDGVVGGDVGGGLCQLSGIVYELLLRAGFQPLERHPHSHDLYTEEERFTPFGLDATVSWPYRDLRLANRLGLAVTIRFGLEALTLRASLHAPRTIAPMTIEIDRIDRRDGRDVRLSRAGEPISHDHYRIAAPAP